MSASEYERIWRETNEELKVVMKRNHWVASRSDRAWNAIFVRKMREAKR